MGRTVNPELAALDKLMWGVIKKQSNLLHFALHYAVDPFLPDCLSLAFTSDKSLNEVSPSYVGLMFESSQNLR